MPDTEHNCDTSETTLEAAHRLRGLRAVPIIDDMRQHGWDCVNVGEGYLSLLERVKDSCIVTVEAVYDCSWDELDAKLKPRHYRTARKMVQAAAHRGLVLCCDLVIKNTEAIVFGRDTYLAAVEPIPKRERISFEVPAGADVRCSVNEGQNWTWVPLNKITREQL